MEKHNKKIIGFNIVEVIIIIIISGVTSSIATGIIASSNNSTSAGIAYSDLIKDKNVRNFLDVYSDVLDDYYEDVDKDKVIDSAIKGMMNYLDDKYTTYLDDNQSDSLNNSLAGTYKGIGVYVKEGGTIEEVFENSPAEKAGLRVGDQIVEVNNQDVTQMKLSDMTGLIKGSDSSVELKIKRDSNTFNVNVEVKIIEKPAIDYEVKTKDDKKYGYLVIGSFTSTVSDQVQKAVKKMESENIEALIIDLRYNGGGYLSAASDIASMFLEKDKLIYSLEGKVDRDTYEDKTDEKRNYKVVVLVNEGTASASEILAAALKDSYGATIVGKKTYGKGKVQQTKTLNDGTMVKYTTAKWFRPNGECVDEVGITPDYEVELEKNEQDEIVDTQLDKAIEVIFN